MKATIKQNDGLRMLSSITKITTSDLEHRIISKMEEEQLLSGNMEDCGHSVLEVIAQSGYDAQDAINILFPEFYKNEEIIQILDSIIVWGNGGDIECPECGCEMIVENESSWINCKCENSDCGHATTNEPDWDTMKGGKDYERN